MKHLISLAIILLSIISESFSQAVITGKVSEKIKQLDYHRKCFKPNEFDNFDFIIWSSQKDSAEKCTDDLGNFTLNIPEGEQSITFLSLINYSKITKDISPKAGDTLVMNIEFPTYNDTLYDAFPLTSYVIIGYQVHFLEKGSFLNIKCKEMNFANGYTSSYSDYSYAGFNIQPEFRFDPYRLKWLNYVDIMLNSSHFFSPNGNHHKNTLHFRLANFWQKENYDNWLRFNYILGYIVRNYGSIEPFSNPRNLVSDNVKNGAAIYLGCKRISYNSCIFLEDFDWLSSGWNKNITIINNIDIRIKNNFLFNFYGMYKNYSDVVGSNGLTSSSISNCAATLSYSSNYITDFLRIRAYTSYLLSNNMDKNIELTRNTGNGILNSIVFELFSGQSGVSLTHTFAKALYSLEGFEIYKLQNTIYDKLSVLATQVYYQKRIRNFSLMTSFKNYSDLLHQNGTCSLELHLLYKPNLYLHRGKISKGHNNYLWHNIF